MKKYLNIPPIRIALLCLFPAGFALNGTTVDQQEKPRVIVTSDGEIDDECSMVRFLLYANEWDIEGIVTSSSQYHWQGHRWAGDDWIEPYLDAYEEVYPNLLKHDPDYPSPQYLRERTFLGNVSAEGEMEEVTDGSRHIMKVLLDESDNRSIWLQAWGGTNTIARALKSIQEEHPEKMAEVAAKIRLFCIWEQDNTYQKYIRPNWEPLGIQTIISDQFEAFAYRWKRYQPEEMQPYFRGTWMKANILEDHGPLCSLYKAHKTGEKGFDEGDFRSEGDSPSFIHQIPTGLRSIENPGWGGWGGRYVRVRGNTWLDPITDKDYVYPEGRYFAGTVWSHDKRYPNKNSTEDAVTRDYFRPIWRWTEALQNDFASRADWCVSPFDEANHPPVVRVCPEGDLNARPGEHLCLSAVGSLDPDGDALTFSWWQYEEADSFTGSIEIPHSDGPMICLTIPAKAKSGDSIHIICEVKDDGTPALTRYQRIVISVL